MSRRIVKIVVDAGGHLVPRESEMPALKDGQVLVKVAVSLVSPGTEMNFIKTRRTKPDTDAKDRPFGYANAGEVVETKGDCGALKPGMRVACMGGGYALHSNYANVPVNMIVPIPDSVSFEQASYACLGATAMQSVRRADPRLGENGIVLGLGIIGNVASQLCMLSGARVAGWETNSFRIDVARRCGIKNTVNSKEVDPVETTKALFAPYASEFAIFAFGGSATKTYESVSKCMVVSGDGHMMGRAVLVGGCEVIIFGGASNGNIDIRVSSRTGPGYHDPVYEHGRSYPAVFVQFDTQRNLKEIIRLIDEHRLLVDPMTSHRIPMSSPDEAANLLLDHPDKALGVIFKMEH